jgi:radical SAM superfamily enzyme YgiQ (UPF0313 family)
MTGGMLPQQVDTLAIVRRCKHLGKPVCVGGPDPTSSPHHYDAADFLVLGEAEGIIDAFVAAWTTGERTGIFQAEKFQADLTKSPVPVRPSGLQALPRRRHSVFTRLSIQLRVLRHHRTLRSGATREDERADGGRARPAAVAD